MIQEIVLATKNKGKCREFKYVLDPFFVQVFTLDDLKIDLPDQIEIHETYKKNAKEKCLYVSKHTEMPILSDDSGIEIDFLGGRPGIFSARYAGTGTDKDNRRKVLEEMIAVPDQNRNARFICIICLYYHKEFYFFQGITTGRILWQESGENGFGYDPIFYSEEMQKSFGLLTFEEKMKISHRGKALHKLTEFLKNTK